jgi:hypothetical protein
MKKIGIMLLALFISSGCAASTFNFGMVNPESYVNKQMYLQQDRLLVETKRWNLVDANRYWLFPFPSQSYYSNYINSRVPTAAEYQSNASFYRLWKGSTLTGWTRVLGVVHKGTGYHITDIAPKMQGGNWTIIEMDEGPYQARSAVLF